MGVIQMGVDCYPSLKSAITLDYQSSWSLCTQNCVRQGAPYKIPLKKMDEIQNFIIPTAELSIILCKPQVQESDVFCKINVRPSASIMN